MHGFRRRTDCLYSWLQNWWSRKGNAVNLSMIGMGTNRCSSGYILYQVLGLLPWWVCSLYFSKLSYEPTDIILPQVKCLARPTQLEDGCYLVSVRNLVISGIQLYYTITTRWLRPVLLWNRIRRRHSMWLLDLEIDGLRQWQDSKCRFIVPVQRYEVEVWTSQGQGSVLFFFGVVVATLHLTEILAS